MDERECAFDEWKVLQWFVEMTDSFYLLIHQCKMNDGRMTIGNIWVCVCVCISVRGKNCFDSFAIMILSAINNNNQRQTIEKMISGWTLTHANWLVVSK